MTIPPASHPIWGDVVTGRKTVVLEFLAANMLIARLRLVMYADQQPATVVRRGKELYGLYASNSGLPSARRNLEKLGSER